MTHPVPHRAQVTTANLLAMLGERRAAVERRLGLATEDRTGTDVVSRPGALP